VLDPLPIADSHGTFVVVVVEPDTIVIVVLHPVDLEGPWAAKKM